MNEMCFFYDSAYVNTKGGGEKRLFMIAKNAIENGYKIKWICFNFWKESYISYDKLGIKHIGIIPKPNFYDQYGNRSKKEPILYLINCFLCIPYFFRSKVWVIGQWPMVHIIPLVLLGLILRKNIYVEWWETLENQWVKKGLAGKIGKLIEHITIKMSSFVTFVVECESEKELMLRKNPKAKVMITPNGVDINYFSDNSKEYHFDFVSMCRLKNHKRVDLLIEATRRIIDTTGKTDIKVAIIGTGPEKEKLINLSKSLDLENNITFFGFIEEYNKAVSILLSSKVGILTTVAGGKGNVVISELFAAELPVIAIGSEEGIDPRYIKESINGYITQTVSSEELADLMIKISKDEKKLFSMKSKLADEKHQLDWSVTLKNHPALNINK
jgi:glycosyltransferase involved in cell wall biosynthesis